MTAPLKRRGAAFFMLFGMEPFLSRGSGEMKRGKTAITLPAGPLWRLRHHLCPGGKRVTEFSVACRLPMNPVPLPPRRSRGHYGRWAFESIYVYGDNGGKPYNRASPVEMHPFWCCAPLPPGGKFSRRLAFEFISNSRYSAARISPSGVASERDL